MHGPMYRLMEQIILFSYYMCSSSLYMYVLHNALHCCTSTDFGLAKDLYSSDYYQVEGERKLPVRWMAPEALLQGRFTIESDVW